VGKVVSCRCLVLAAIKVLPQSRRSLTTLALHDRYCDLLVQSAPNIAAVRRAQLNEASVRGMSMAQLVQSRAKLVEQIAWQESELSKLQSIGVYVDSLAQKSKISRDGPVNLLQALSGLSG
jgi:hypothetical protein